jgi:hypothetical protein
LPPPSTYSLSTSSCSYMSSKASWTRSLHSLPRLWRGSRPTVVVVQVGSRPMCNLSARYCNPSSYRLICYCRRRKLIWKLCPPSRPTHCPRALTCHNLAWLRRGLGSAGLKAIPHSACWSSRCALCRGLWHLHYC